MHDTAGAAAKASRDGASVRKRLLTVLFLSTATASATVFMPAFAQQYAFNQVVIEGNQLVDNATILGFAGIRRGETLTQGGLNDAYQGLVRSGLFETVEIVPQGNQLVIRVKEYPIVNVINFEGNKRLKDEDLAKIIQSKQRRVYSPSVAEADAAAIAEAYQARGRIAATVTPKLIRRSGGRVDLAFEITEGRVTEIERLSFVGNRAFSDRRLRQVLQTKQAGLLRTLIQRDTFVAERLEVDKQMLRDFYLARGYIDIQVTDASAEVARERDAVFVSFSIREGRQYRFGNITTTSEVNGVDAAEYGALSRVRSGVPYSPLVVENTIARMENLALRKGLNFVRVDPRITRNDRDGTLDLEFALVRGDRVFVERIDIEGNTTTLDQVIRRQFRSAEGDPFNPREVRQSAERIRALGFFSDAQVDARPGSAADQVIVDVNVEEQPTGSLSFGASYGADAGVGVNIGFAESNFLGRGQALSVAIATGSDSTSSSLSITEPAFLGRDLSLSLGAFYNITDQKNAIYDTANVGARAALSFPVGEVSRLELRYGLSKNTIKNYQGKDVNGDGVIDPATERNPTLVAESARDGEFTSAIGYTYSYDTRIGGLSPDRGMVFRFSQDFAGLGGDAKYISSEVQALGERKILSEEVTLRAIFEAGTISPLGGYGTRVTERFFGNGKIRGFEGNGIGPRDQVTGDALGGNFYAVARFEADFPIGLPEEYGLSGGLFMDVGSVWGLKGNIVDALGAPIDTGFNPRAAVGVSVLWDAPIGPLRFNFSKALKKEDYDKERSFDLTISTQF
ncbi:outer membrane protein assembly factor BamA [Pseudotabrizicola alkalilacus]|uniref:Outer membrane protein assembly factor BamA n=1 Tax=Pseudotabrizicola alkalilacus TaxID=2305252 RepID=A0A411YZ33_9RHOB|nr:outer membrane protein assembly factor BamA [Pseudotabrizicola alkalilacus]RGP36070.1 outer membrane protein assembly factor BamA [Pseudotabrizicola alkalilacus]